MELFIDYVFELICIPEIFISGILTLIAVLVLVAVLFLFKKNMYHNPAVASPFENWMYEYIILKIKSTRQSKKEKYTIIFFSLLSIVSGITIFYAVTSDIELTFLFTPLRILDAQLYCTLGITTRILTSKYKKPPLV